MTEMPWTDAPLDGDRLTASATRDLVTDCASHQHCDDCGACVPAGPESSRECQDCRVKRLLDGEYAQLSVVARLLSWAKISIREE